MKKITTLLIFIILANFLVINFISAHEGEGEFNHHGMIGGYSSLGMFQMGFFGPIVMFLLTFALILFIFWLIKQLGGGKSKKRK